MRGEAPTFFGAYGEWMLTPNPTWDDLAWLRERWDGEPMIKGVSHPDDALQGSHRRRRNLGQQLRRPQPPGGNHQNGLASAPASTGSSMPVM